jgi:hypothetical protein
MLTAKTKPKSKPRHSLSSTSQALAQAISQTKVAAYERAFSMDSATTKIYSWAVDKTIDILLVRICNLLKEVEEGFDEDLFYGEVFKS